MTERLLLHVLILVAATTTIAIGVGADITPITSDEARQQLVAAAKKAGPPRTMKKIAQERLQDYSEKAKRTRAKVADLTAAQTALHRQMRARDEQAFHEAVTQVSFADKDAALQIAVIDALADVASLEAAFYVLSRARLLAASLLAFLKLGLSEEEYAESPFPAARLNRGPQLVAWLKLDNTTALQGVVQTLIVSGDTSAGMRSMLIQHKVLNESFPQHPDDIDYPPSEELLEAKSRLALLQRAEGDAHADVASIERSPSAEAVRDYGPDNVWQSLEGRCTATHYVETASPQGATTGDNETTDGSASPSTPSTPQQLTAEVCLFSHAMLGHDRLRFVELDRTSVEAATNTTVVHMIFGRGLWECPHRRRFLIVSLACGAELSVAPVNSTPCATFLQGTCPAACESHHSSTPKPAATTPPGSAETQAVPSPDGEAVIVSDAP